MEQQSLSLEVPHARASVSQDCGRDWLILVATWPSNISALLMEFARDGWSGKTSPVSCHLTEGGRLEPSSEGWRNSGMGSLTECWTLNTSEFNHTLVPSPNDDGVCSLSDVLETGEVPQRYYLSARACAGILRRAEKREKELPKMLHAALFAVAQGLHEECRKQKAVTS